MIFIVTFNDLAFDKQRDMVDSIKKLLLEDYEREATSGTYGKNFGRKEYENMTWQEAFAREYSIDYLLYETKEEAKYFDWNFAVEQYAEDQAEEKCRATYYEWEVEI